MPISSYLACVRVRPPGRSGAIVLAAVLVAGCGRGKAPVEAARSADAFFGVIPSRLAAEGPTAWLELFEDGPTFFMASDGAVAFADRAEAEAFLAEFAPRVSTMRLEWIEPRLDLLTPSLAVVSSSYAEEIVMTDGTVSSFGGHVSGVLRRSGGAWKIQHLHWSSPPADGG